jgi:hypothetical protein
VPLHSKERDGCLNTLLQKSWFFLSERLEGELFDGRGRDGLPIQQWQVLTWRDSLG